MTVKKVVKTAGAIGAISAIALASLLISSPGVQGNEDDRGNNESKIQQGFKIAPVPLNLDGLDLELVGLGSYIVNTNGCNDCHDTGPAAQFAPGGNPYFGQPKKINPKTYLGGGGFLPRYRDHLRRRSFPAI